MEMSSLFPHVEGSAGGFAFEVIPDMSGLSRTDLQRPTIHILESNAAERAAAFRLISQFGYHCEIYSTVDEFISYKPTSGILLAHDGPGENSIAAVLNRTREIGLPLMVIGCSKSPSTDMVVLAMRAGAQYYFELPFDQQTIGPVLATLAEASKILQKSHEARVNARSKVRRLSPRENQVIALIVEGNGNKAIARELGLSPRTIEIHRSKAMSRLGAQNASEAVKIWLLGNEDL